MSSENEKLILVDESDNEIGLLSKAECHDGSGVLHRAFSVFIFNADGDLLLQQRGKGKRLWLFVTFVRPKIRMLNHNECMVSI